MAHAIQMVVGSDLTPAATARSIVGGAEPMPGEWCLSADVTAARAHGDDSWTCNIGNTLVLSVYHRSYPATSSGKSFRLGFVADPISLIQLVSAASTR